MLKLVTPNGKYHGDVEDVAAAQKVIAVSKLENARTINESQWAQAVANPDQRAAIFASGSPVN